MNSKQKIIHLIPIDSSKSAILHSVNSTEFIRARYVFLSCFFLTTRTSHNAAWIGIFSCLKAILHVTTQLFALGSLFLILEIVKQPVVRTISNSQKYLLLDQLWPWLDKTPHTHPSCWRRCLPFLRKFEDVQLHRQKDILDILKNKRYFLQLPGKYQCGLIYQIKYEQKFYSR